MGTNMLGLNVNLLLQTQVVNPPAGNDAQYYNSLYVILFIVVSVIVNGFILFFTVKKMRDVIYNDSFGKRMLAFAVVLFLLLLHYQTFVAYQYIFNVPMMNSDEFILFVKDLIK